MFSVSQIISILYHYNYYKALLSFIVYVIVRVNQTRVHYIHRYYYLPVHRLSYLLVHYLMNL